MPEPNQRSGKKKKKRRRRAFGQDEFEDNPALSMNESPSPMKGVFLREEMKD